MALLNPASKYRSIFSWEKNSPLAPDINSAAEVSASCAVSVNASPPTLLASSSAAVFLNALGITVLFANISSANLVFPAPPNLSNIRLGRNESNIAIGTAIASDI